MGASSARTREQKLRRRRFVDGILISRGERMRALAIAVSLGAIVFLSSVATARAADPVACGLLTPDQLNSATGATLGAGTPISGPTNCQWITKGKIVTLTIRQTLAGKSPVDQFNSAKSQMLGGVAT